ncbi:MAG: ribosomal protein methyltransferase [Tenuifilum sp.]|jgi:ribosomal protein L11 methyltransferase|uniref:50S ribosomal protein L11 methyltransferase n=1 Tax=Tenuifilum sp. TaxID=2760880 RepID=UPI0024AC3F32|nr:50S ribosomal protein L11 methyltransferase [Tenuifilum sp.]MDI3526870.1 ribosomal protein methyltransferase [Tenuifilum sp.]
MSYTEFRITVEPYSTDTVDMIIAQLSELGFESFMEAEPELLAYIQTNRLKDLPSNFFAQIILPNDAQIEIKRQEIPDKNWNEVWESNFEPIIVDNRCLVRASFHHDTPNVDYEIVIDPKMAFGTGHHQTTSLMISALLNSQVDGLSVLDMGCGTGVLAILAEMRGAKSVVAIDNDEWAYRNTLENIKLNGCERIKAFLGDANLLKEYKFDIILANINLNILIADLSKYANSLKDNGKIFMSGILKDDVDTLEMEASKNGLSPIDVQFKDGWAMVSFKK